MDRIDGVAVSLEAKSKATTSSIRLSLLQYTACQSCNKGASPRGSLVWCIYSQAETKRCADWLLGDVGGCLSMAIEASTMTMSLLVGIPIFLVSGFASEKACCT